MSAGIFARAVAMAAACVGFPVAAQAQNIPQAYQAACAACHGPSLEGSGFAPPLKGEAFQGRWRNGGLLPRIRTTMPPANPGSLPAESYAEIARYIAHANGLREVSSPVPASAAGRMPIAPAVGGREGPDRITREAAERRAAVARRVGPVTEAMLLAPPGQDWLTWRGGQDARGFSSLRQIDRSNAARLTPAWTLALGTGTNGMIPLVHDGVMYLNVNGRVLALDATNGERLWEYVGEPVNNTRIPHSQGRGLALYGDKVYLPTLDGTIVALDAGTGQRAWAQKIFQPGEQLQLTAPPLIARGKLIQPVAGCQGSAYPGGCFIVGLDAETGAEVWRFHTIARPGQPGGDSWNGAPVEERFGGSVWTPGSYDADLGLVYFGVAQTYRPSTLLRPNARKGESADALYTDSTVALDPGDGRLVWHFQHLPGDVWDTDWAFEQTLIDAEFGGVRTRALVSSGKPAIIDVLDARTGRFRYARDLGLQTIVLHIDPKTGRKRINPEALQIAERPVVVCPGNGGARTWPASAYDPATGVMYLPLVENCMEVFLPPSATDVVRLPRVRPDTDGKFGRLAAIELTTGRTLWTSRERATPVSSTLATAGGLVFQGWRDRVFRASNSATGETLWQIRLDDMPNSFPITYAANGVQYVAVVSGGGTPAEILGRDLAPEIPPPSGSRTLWAFRLAD